MHIQNRKDAARWQVARKDEKRLNRVEATAKLAQPARITLSPNCNPIAFS
jgi:hypothetical protein